MKTRVLLADDHQIFREALRALLDKDPAIVVVGDTGNGEMVLDLAKQTSPDLVVMDICMPGLDGVQATRRLLAEHPAVKVIALSSYSEKGFVTEMLAAGAAGYVVKAAAADELLRAIGEVSRNNIYLSPEVAASVIDVVRDPRPASTEPGARLGKRERQVLQLIAEGMTSPQIAAQLHIATGTVDVHRRNIMQKLDLRSVADLTKYAIRHGLTSI